MTFLKLLLPLFLLLSCATTNQVNTVKVFKPKTVKDLYNTSALILAADGSSGGSGVVWRSSVKESLILTNRHVCKSLEYGGNVVIKGTQNYLVSNYRVSKKHDMCMVTVAGNLGYNLKVKRTPPELHSKVRISGHPGLYPHVLSEGYISDNQDIRVAVDSRECTKDEQAKDPIGCLFFGFPIYESFNSTLVTALIAPGSSGSGVFTTKGELVGLAFASNSEELAYALIVPWKYLEKFVREEVHTLEKIVPKEPKEQTENKSRRTRKLAPFTQKPDKFYDLDTWKKLLELLEKTK